MSERSTDKPILDEFRGDTENLRLSIKALIQLGDADALFPNKLGGHARALLAAAYRRLNPGPMSSNEGTGPVLYDSAYPGSMSQRTDGDYVRADDPASLAAALLKKISDQEREIEDLKAGFTAIRERDKEAVRELLAEARQPTGWRPIAEALKGETPVDLWAFNRRYTDMRWESTRRMWGNLVGQWLHEDEPTHFMPLPAAPGGEGVERE